ncbi:MAG: hypothetical protein ACE5J2_08840 [Nitrososphaerales archaeon]
MQKLKTRQENVTERDSPTTGFKNTETVTNEINTIDLLACKSGDHGGIVWDKDSNSNTIVFCSHCHQIMYDGKQLNMEVLG